METITFRCTTCKFVLKVGADKAGRKAKCSKCGTLLIIPAATDVGPAAPPPAPPAAAKKTSDDEDGDQTYQLKETPDPAQEPSVLVEPSAPKVLKKPGRPATKREARITNPEEWRRVGFGAKIIAVGLGMWLVGYLLYRVPLVLGMTAGEDYATGADVRLTPGAGDLDLYAYAVAVIAGASWADTMIWLARLSQVLMLLLYGPLLAGYVTCLAVPDRFGARLQLKVLLGLALINALILIVFKLLPMFGITHYTLIPFVMPEVTMLEMNAERNESLVSFWLKVPFLEVFLAILLTLVHYLEPAMIATFVHNAGKSLKSEELEATGLKAMMLGYSQLFIQTAWLMASLCGTSVVLLWALRLLYVVGAGFFVYQLMCTITALLSVSGVVEEQLGDEAAKAPRGEEEEDQGPEDEEED
jgi:uncharacterized membrane protein